MKQPQEKIKPLLHVVYHHFIQGEKIQIIAPDTKSLAFLSDLFWKEPKESFLPHSVSTLLPFHENIFLCLPQKGNEKEALSQFPFLFNLSPFPAPSLPGIKVIYELEDHTKSEKKAHFQMKFSHYQKLGISITCGSKA